MLKQEDKEWARKQARIFIAALKSLPEYYERPLTDHDYDKLLEVVRYMAGTIAQERPAKSDPKFKNPFLAEIPEVYIKNEMD